MAIKRNLDTCLASQKPTEIRLSGRHKIECYSADEIERIAEMPSLTKVEIDRQAITKLPAALGQLPNLETLRLGDCRGLTSLAGIEKLGRVRELHLSSLTLSARELGRLGDLPDLSMLVLRGVDLPPLAAMHSVIELRIINAGDLEKTIATLAKHASLRTLLIENHLASFELPDAIASLQQIRKLTVRAHKTLTLPREIGALAQLEVLSLGRLRKIPGEIFDCAALTELRLDGPFKMVPSSIAKLKKLRTLELPWRGRYTVPGELFAMSLKTFEGPQAIAKKIGRGEQATDTDDDLEDLTYYRFELGDLEAQLTKLVRATKLAELQVNCPETTHVPAQLGKLTQLTSLLVAGARVIDISPKLGELTRLTTLRLWSPELRAVPATLGDLGALEQLDIRSHPELEIPDSIGKLGKLSWLRANTELPAGIAKCATLRNVWWTIDKPPPAASLAALGKLAALRSLQIIHAKVDLDALGRAFADHPLERLELGHTTGCDLSQLTGLHEVSLREDVADSLKLCEGKWTRTAPRVGIARFRRRATGRP